MEKRLQAVSHVEHVYFESQNIRARTDLNLQNLVRLYVLLCLYFVVCRKRERVDLVFTATA